MKVLYRIIALMVVVVVALFAISNYGVVTVSIWPVPYVLDLPLYAVVLAGVFIGFVAGSVLTWFSGHKWRREARAKARDAERLERELAALDERQASAEPEAPAATPAGRELAPAKFE